MSNDIEKQIVQDCGIIGSLDFWRIWIRAICNDPQMSAERAIKHLQRHVSKHIPDPKDAKERWEEWIAGTYNLLAIVGQTVNCADPHEVGVNLLFRKWVQSPFDHTPPPQHGNKKFTKKRPVKEEAWESSGS
jgi:hypothetical protein